MNKIKNIASIGGDNRQKYAVDKLLNQGFNADIINILDDNTGFYDAFVLPLPLTTDGCRINSSNISLNEFIKSIMAHQTVFAGKINQEITKQLNEKKIKFHDYYNRDEFSLKNAEPTAMGVLSYVMNHSVVTASKMKVLVIGYGKCGRAVSKIFRDLGATVTASSRKYISLAQAESDGCGACLLKDVYNYVNNADVIVNTVPIKILNNSFIDRIADNAIVIDISSAPYGFDYDYAKSVGKKITLMPSIPGKYFPKTAGEIIADTIINIIEEGDFE